MISCPLVEVLMNSELERQPADYKTEKHSMEYTDIHKVHLKLI